MILSKNGPNRLPPQPLDESVRIEAVIASYEAGIADAKVDGRRAI